MPKYLNSPETPIYSKSRTLYGLSLTKGDLRKSGFAIIVEGYFDFAQVYQAGGLPVVATCGTALTTHAGAHAPPLRVENGALLRPRCGRPGRGRAQLRAAGQRRIRRQRGAAAGRPRSRYLRAEPRPRRLCRELGSRGRIWSSCSTARPPATTWRATMRAASFCKKMLAVAARIPDPAARDQFADRLAHKARVTEEVVRSEIRKAAARERPSCPLDRLRSLTAPLRDVEKGLLWALVHAPGEAIRGPRLLEVADFEGLRSQSCSKRRVRCRASPAEELPGALMERLTDHEAQLLSRVATERSRPSRTWTMRSGAAIRADRTPTGRDPAGHRRRCAKSPDDSVDEPLLRQKNDLRTQLELAQRTARRLHIIDSLLRSFEYVIVWEESTTLSIEDKFDEVRQLIIVGKEKGYLLYDEVSDLLPADLTASPEDLEELFAAFGDAGIDLVDSEKSYVQRDGLEREDGERSSGARPHARRARQDQRSRPHVPARDGHGAAAHARRRSRDCQAHRAGQALGHQVDLAHAGDHQGRHPHGRCAARRRPHHPRAGHLQRRRDHRRPHRGTGAAVPASRSKACARRG